MAGQTKGNIPASPACGQWETLLVDAMDGQLRPEDESVFSSHMATCAACTEMFEQVRRGREWLEFLAPEPEVPAYLLEKILVETGHGKADPAKFAAGKLAIAGGPDVLSMPPVWQQPGFGRTMRRFAEPRLLMTAAMAFFSIALTLSITGVRFSGVKMADLRPTAVRSALEKRIMTASTPIVRYYDHLRFVYEVESTMREMRRNSENQTQQQNQKKSQPTGSGGEGESHKKDGGSKINPNQAPQQTVNPPASLWGRDTLEARLPMPSQNQRNSKGFSTLTAASGSIDAGSASTEILEVGSIRSGSFRTGSFGIGNLKTGFFSISVSAMPERSTPCIA